MSLRALEAYEDGLLSAAGRARVEAKLARDPALRRLRAALRSYRAVLAELPAPRALADGLDHSLATRVAAAHALDRALSDARDVEAALDPHVDHALATRLATERALGAVLDEARAPTPKLDMAALEAKLFAAIASEPAGVSDTVSDTIARPLPARAIAAYADGRLSAAGRRRLEARAATRPELAEALVRARALAELRRESERAAREAVSAARLERLELPLRREVARIDSARARRRWIGGTALGLAAAAAFALLLTRPPAASHPVAEVEPDPIAPLVVAAPALDAEITALAGEATIDGRDEPLTLGDTLREGELVTVAGSLHARIDEGTGVAIAPGLFRDRPSTSARVRLERLRADGIELALVEGRVASEVLTGTPYAIVAGPYRIEVRGTRFSVDRDADAVAVRLDEGRVAISRDGELLVLLEAPAEWQSSDALDVPRAVERPRALASELRWPAFRLPSGRFVEIELDGSVLPALDGLAMRVPAGEHELIAVDAEGRRHRGIVSVDEGFVFDERALTAEPSAPRRGYLAPEVIREVVTPRVEQLKRCYERSLRRTHPELAGSYVLRVIVGTDGHVRRVRVVTDGEMPPPFVTCLQLEAQAWVFPRPEGDGPVTFDLPLAFSARGL